MPLGAPMQVPMQQSASAVHGRPVGAQHSSLWHTTSPLTGLQHGRDSQS